MTTAVLLDHVSWSQMSKPCPLQLKGRREGWEQGPQNISLAYGRAGHAGIEYHLQTHEGRERAIEVAQEAIYEEIAKAHPPGVRWDEPPRTRRDGQMYSGDEARIPDIETAHEGLRLQVGAWVDTFGELQAAAPDGGLPIERGIKVPLDEFGFAGWELESHLDVLTDDGGIVDLKFAKEWKPEEVDDKLDQGHLYHLAYRHLFGHPASYLAFHNGIKGSGVWHPIRVDYDPAAISRVVEHLVGPTIRMIEANAYTPNRRSPFPHSEDWCEYWHSCPFGARARSVA